MKQFITTLLQCAILMSSATAQTMLTENIRLDAYCPGDEYAKVTVVSEKPDYTFNWQHNGDLSPSTTIPRSLFGQEICVERICPCGSRDLVCFVFHDEQYPEIQINAEVSDVSCYGAHDGSVQLSINDKVALQWSNGAAGAQLHHLPSGLYSVTAVNARGCTASASFSVKEPAPLSKDVHIETFNTKCPGTADGKAILSGISSEEAAIFWSEGTGNGVSADGLSAGNHYVRIRTTSGACSTFPFSIGSPTSAELSTRIIEPVRCYGERNGVAQITVMGERTPFSLNFLGNTYQPGPDGKVQIAGLPAGDYPFTVSDKNGCTVESRLAIHQPALLEAIVNIPNHSGYAIACHGDEATASAIISGGNGGYTFSWLKGIAKLGNNDPSAQLGPGTYTLIVQDQKGCEAKTGFLLEEPDKLDIKFRYLVKNRLFALARAEAKGGVGDTHLSRRTFLSFSESKRITVVVTDGNGCQEDEKFYLKKTKPSKQGKIKRRRLDPNRHQNCYEDILQAILSFFRKYSRNAPKVRC